MLLSSLLPIVRFSLLYIFRNGSVELLFVLRVIDIETLFDHFTKVTPILHMHTVMKRKTVTTEFRSQKIIYIEKRLVKDIGK